MGEVRKDEVNSLLSCIAGFVVMSVLIGFMCLYSWLAERITKQLWKENDMDQVIREHVERHTDNAPDNMIYQKHDDQ